MRRTLISIVLTFLILYVGTGILLSSENDRPFSGVEQMKAWLFTFGWSLGNWGYLLMVVLILLLFFLIRWLLGKIFSKC